MKIKEAYALLADRVGIEPDLMPYLSEVMLDLTVLNPMLPDTVRQFGKVMNLRPGQTVLELGCGKAGVSLPMVYVYKVRLTGVDLMPDFISEAWSRAEYSGLAESCRFKIDDVVDFTDRTESQWDAVVVCGALSIIWDGLEKGLEKIKPLIKPGGHLLIGEPYRRPDRESLPEAPHTKEEITSIMNRFGQVLDVFDDGEEGWRAYVDPQKKNTDRLKENHPDNRELIDFLDAWIKRIEWEPDNIGFAAWVIKVEDE